MLKISKRLNAIVKTCPSLPVWADIGCDHGLLSAALITNNKARNVIASDISEPSLYKAKDLALRLALTDKIDLRIGNGLSVLKENEAQGAVLAGMGSPLMIEILKFGIEQNKAPGTLVLSPNNYPERLRGFAVENGYDIIKEKYVLENERVYPIMLLEKSDGAVAKLSKSELYCGRNPVKDEEYFSCIEALLNREKKIVSEIGIKNEKSELHEELAEIYGGVR